MNVNVLQWFHGPYIHERERVTIVYGPYIHERERVTIVSWTIYI